MSACMVTITGREHHLSGDEVQQQMIDIYDIAWSLSQINRFTGHAMRPYSVAEHSLFVAELAERDGKTPLVQLACLLHDAHEAFTNDLSSPAKNAIGLAWGKFEALQADRVRRLLGVNDAFRQHGALIQYFDLQALATERLQLTNYNPRHHAPWPVLDSPGQEIRPCGWANLTGHGFSRRNWKEWRDAFSLRYFDLLRAVQADGSAALSPEVMA
jgi:hypothetical protein